MLTVFNRRELITIADTAMYMGIKQCLTEQNISNQTKFISGGGMSHRGSAHGYHQPLYRIYVHRDDYDRAMAAIQSALRG